MNKIDFWENSAQLSKYQTSATLFISLKFRYYKGNILLLPSLIGGKVEGATSLFLT